MLHYDNFEIYWDGHASVRVCDDGFTVAVDPFREVSSDFRADLVLVTQEGEGHYDPDILEKVCKPNTCVVLPESMEDRDVPCNDVEFIPEGEMIDVFGIEIDALPMYNDDSERGKGVGYRFVMRGTRFYVAGDTGLIEESWDLEGRVDVCFLPVDGTDNMGVEEAIKMSVRIKPAVVVPYHFGEPFFPDAEVDLRGLKAELEDRNISCEIIDD